MIEFAGHTWGFSDLTLVEALGTIARLGFRYVDIGSGANLNTLKAAENPRGAADDIRQHLDLFNLKVSDLYLLLPRISMSDEKGRQKDLELFRALVPFALALGTPGITLSAGVTQPAKDVEAPDRSVAALRDMVKTGRAAGLAVSIEPHLDSMAQTPEQALKLVGDVPGLALTVDWAQMVCQGAGREDVRSLLPHARHIQVRPAARGKLQVPFEEGQIDPEQIMEDLLASGYAGVVSVEILQTVGWQGTVTVNPIIESVRTRDALRVARDRHLKKAQA